MINKLDIYFFRCGFSTLDVGYEYAMSVPNTLTFILLRKLHKLRIFGMKSICTCSLLWIHAYIKRNACKFKVVLKQEHLKKPNNVREHFSFYGKLNELARVN